MYCAYIYKLNRVVFCFQMLMTFANSLDPDNAKQKGGPRVRSKLFDTLIIYQQISLIKIISYCNFERRKYVLFIPHANS